MELDQRFIDKLAEVAKLRLSFEEKNQFEKQFNELFLHFAKVREVETSSSISQVVTAADATRSDTVERFPDTKLIISQIPKKKDELAIVPRSL